MTYLKSIKRRITRSSLVIAVTIAAVVGAAKLLFQYLGLEFLAVNPLLSAIISGNIFILGFLLNSTLRDYKEAEKFPGMLSTSLETIYDECEIIWKNKGSEVAKRCIQHIQKVNALLVSWFHKRAYTQEVLMEISNFNSYFHDMEPLTQANFIVRLKNEQSSMRRSLIMVNTLRDTPFYETSYTIARLSIGLQLIMLTLLTANPFYEYLFFTVLITFINVFLVNLIKDLDDPFEYTDANKPDEVSLKPFADLEARINSRMKS